MVTKPHNCRIHSSMVFYARFIDIRETFVNLARSWDWQLPFLSESVNAMLFAALGAIAALLVFRTVRFGPGRWILAVLWGAPLCVPFVLRHPAQEDVYTWWSVPYALLLIVVFGTRCALIACGVLTPVLRIGIVAAFSSETSMEEKQRFVSENLAKVVERVGAQRKVRLIIYGSFLGLSNTILRQTPISWMIRSIDVRPHINMRRSGLHYRQEWRSYKNKKRAISAFMGQTDYLVVFGDRQEIENLPNVLIGYHSRVESGATVSFYVRENEETAEANSV